ncbi:uncharacterized protein VP01_751g6 [Puccinia sorghi]|uniref:Uncharacterized protein n=1 Tax=Puccinia sorghi TaxID=27349 RepID=A0A0L6UE86_9BASI|nr:uncharacterized protein VP01_751g6 [Puccinia sorghi]
MASCPISIQPSKWGGGAGSHLAVNRHFPNSTTPASAHSSGPLLHKIWTPWLPAGPAHLGFLAEINWLWDVATKTSGAIQKLFLSHLGSIHLAKINNHVVLLDATYLKNNYKLPLLHLIGQTENKQECISDCSPKSTGTAGVVERKTCSLVPLQKTNRYALS